MEGHCDDRGTNAYKIALGERRAESVKMFLVDLGIGTNRLNTVSYGEERPDADDCILCALCTRVCDAMGFSAISAEGRGHGREISPPLNAPPPDCTGCLSCARVCPTGHIKFDDRGSTLTIWGKTFEKVQCKETGEYTITKDFAEYLSKHRDIPPGYFEHSDLSHRKQTAAAMGRIAQWTREAAK